MSRSSFNTGVETLFEGGGNLTVLRCTTGLQYDGTPWDVFARMLGPQGVSLSWLSTRYTDTTGYRIYKIADVTQPFAEDTSATLLREVVVRKADCGLTYYPLNFRDITTGGEPGLSVGYAVVPLDDAFEEIKDKVGMSGFIVTWWGNIQVRVQAEGGGPVRDVLVRVSAQICISTASTPSTRCLLDGVVVRFLRLNLTGLRTGSGLAPVGGRWAGPALRQLRRGPD